MITVDVETIRHGENVTELYTRLMQTLSTTKILPFVKLNYVLVNSNSFYNDNYYDERLDFEQGQVYARFCGNSIVAGVLFENDKNRKNFFIEFSTSENNIDVYFKMLKIGGIVNLLLSKWEKTVSLPQGEMRLDCNIIEETENYNSINEKSDNITVDGHIGTWHVIDTTQIYGADYFLLGSGGGILNNIIVNKTGALVAEDIKNGFEDENFKNEKMQQKRYFEQLQKFDKIVEEQIVVEVGEMEM